ncbi:MAG: hypothetical protein OXF27_02870 [Acidobacteria bacterium]|nr:hypothetical protein [Acidobacteriota bacterium]
MPPSNRAGFVRPASRHTVGFRDNATRINFYREELAKHRQCLEQHREYYSDKVIGDVEAALTRLMSEVDNLCTRENGDQLVSRLLREIDVVTRLSVWSEQKNSH